MFRHLSDPIAWLSRRILHIRYWSRTSASQSARRRSCAVRIYIWRRAGIMCSREEMARASRVSGILFSHYTPKSSKLWGSICLGSLYRMRLLHKRIGACLRRLAMTAHLSRRVMRSGPVIRTSSPRGQRHQPPDDCSNLLRMAMESSSTHITFGYELQKKKKKTKLTDAISTSDPPRHSQQSDPQHRAEPTHPPPGPDRPAAAPRHHRPRRPRCPRHTRRRHRL
ncbi:hypothetical protein MPH_10046 [Macrophomina phaseolina MS6]|uniref:Uncharacterized protein n=1 Tax=Macrophomina phaseolina (strain MS6) TaxID=1126212 RepID=K2RDY7_MACPH|nr:hypothetical protein MPH_10046 [Macrophomina phaseolina MS6]